MKPGVGTRVATDPERLYKCLVQWTGGAREQKGRDRVAFQNEDILHDSETYTWKTWQYEPTAIPSLPSSIAAEEADTETSPQPSHTEADAVSLPPEQEEDEVQATKRAKRVVMYRS